MKAFRIYSIILKEFKQNIRDYKANLMMVLFPIVLITILGAAFSNLFSGSVSIDGFKVLYTIDVEQNKQFVDSFKAFCDILSDELGVQFESTNDIEAGKASIENYIYSAYVHVTENPIQFTLYKNDRKSFNADLLENALKSYIKNYNAMSAVAAHNPAAFELPGFQEYRNYVSVRSLDRKRQPGSTDYYAVTMTTLILLYASLTGLWSIRNEIGQKTSARILSAPVHAYELLAGKVAGCIIVTIVQGVIVVLFSKLILKAYWGENLLPAALLLFTYSIMTVGLGAALAFIVQNGEAASGILNTIIPVFVFLGGGYAPLSGLGGAVAKISLISPVRWVNTALFNVIYGNDYSVVPISMGINLGLAMLFIAISAIFSRKGNRVYA